MRITVRSGRFDEVRDGVPVYAALEGEQKPERLLPAVAGRDPALSRLVAAAGFRGAANETVFLPHRNRWVLVVGLGKAKELSIENVRQFAGTAARTVRAKGQRALSLPVLNDRVLGSPSTVAQALSEGALLGLYRYDKLKEIPKHERNRRIEAITLVVERAGDVAGAKRAVEKAQVIADAVFLVRDLITGPSNLITPTVLANEARTLAK